MKWGDNARDFDTALAVWPHYRPLFDNWLMQELVEQGDKAPVWRDRRVPTENGRVRSDVYPDRETALSAAATLNQTLHDALAAREMYAGGHGYRSIGKALGVPRSTVQSWVGKSGNKRRNVEPVRVVVRSRVTRLAP